MIAPWIVYWRVTSVDGLAIRISGQPEDRHTRTIRTADFHAEMTGVWLATVFRLAVERSALLRGNYRYRSVVAPREVPLISSAFEFQAAIRTGEVAACIEQL